MLNTKGKRLALLLAVLLACAGLGVGLALLLGGGAPEKQELPQKNELNLIDGVQSRTIEKAFLTGLRAESFFVPLDGDNCLWRSRGEGVEPLRLTDYAVRSISCFDGRVYFLRMSDSALCSLDFSGSGFRLDVKSCLKYQFYDDTLCFIASNGALTARTFSGEPDRELALSCSSFAVCRGTVYFTHQPNGGVCPLYTLDLASPDAGEQLVAGTSSQKVSSLSSDGRLLCCVESGLLQTPFETAATLGGSIVPAYCCAVINGEYFRLTSGIGTQLSLFSGGTKLPISACCGADVVGEDVYCYSENGTYRCGADERYEQVLPPAAPKASASAGGAFASDGESVFFSSAEGFLCSVQLSRAGIGGLEAVRLGRAAPQALCSFGGYIWFISDGALMRLAADEPGEEPVVFVPQGCTYLAFDGEKLWYVASGAVTSCRLDGSDCCSPLTLSVGERLISTVGGGFLVLRADGSLSLINGDGTELWSAEGEFSDAVLSDGSVYAASAAGITKIGLQSGSAEAVSDAPAERLALCGSALCFTSPSDGSLWRLRLAGGRELLDAEAVSGLTAVGESLFWFSDGAPKRLDSAVELYPAEIVTDAESVFSGVSATAGAISGDWRIPGGHPMRYREDGITYMSTGHFSNYEAICSCGGVLYGSLEGGGIYRLTDETQSLLISGARLLGFCDGRLVYFFNGYVYSCTPDLLSVSLLSERRVSACRYSLGSVYALTEDGGHPLAIRLGDPMEVELAGVSAADAVGHGRDIAYIADGRALLARYGEESAPMAEGVFSLVALRGEWLYYLDTARRLCRADGKTVERLTGAGIASVSEAGGVFSCLSADILTVWSED